MNLHRRLTRLESAGRVRPCPAAPDDDLITADYAAMLAGDRPWPARLAPYAEVFSKLGRGHSGIGDDP